VKNSATDEPRAPSDAADGVARFAISPVVVIAIWTVPGLLSCFQRWAPDYFHAHPTSFWHIVAVQMPDWYLWAAFTPVIFRLARQFPLQRRLSVRVVSAHVAAWLVCLGLHALLAATLSHAFDATDAAVSFPAYVGMAAISWMPSTFLLYFATTGVALWIHSSHRERHHERERSLLSGQLARAELNALRSQLHPHFLFNTLNTIAILIRESDTNVAEQLVTQLGDVLRQVFRGARAHETALGEEIALVSTYLAIEQVRFGDRLTVQWSVEEQSLGAAVPVLVLQPLVENALRHGIARRTAAGTIEVGACRDGADLLLWITDNGPGISPDAGDASFTSFEHGGVGLKNTRERLDRLYPGRSSLQLLRQESGGARAEVHLPYCAWNALPAEATLL
jgi:two-component system, LytTR family, sensor kinase